MQASVSKSMNEGNKITVFDIVENLLFFPFYSWLVFRYNTLFIDLIKKYWFRSTPKKNSLLKS